MRARLGIAAAFLLAALLCAIGPAVFRATARSAPVAPARLEAIADRPIGEWRPVAPVDGFITASPLDDEGQPQEIYDHVVYRSFVRADGTAIMLVLAYLNEQQVRQGVHRPESCYTSQGFALSEAHVTRVLAGGRRIGINGFLATGATREEYVAYWMRVGATVGRSSLSFRLETLHEALAHRVPDGILVRASISQPRGGEHFSPGQAARLLADFLTDLADRAPPADRPMLVG